MPVVHQHVMLLSLLLSIRGNHRYVSSFEQGCPGHVQVPLHYLFSELILTHFKTGGNFAILVNYGGLGNSGSD